VRHLNKFPFTHAVSEFVHLLATSANEACERTTKKTIMPDHLMTALEQLGFGAYLRDVKETNAIVQHQDKAVFNLIVC
jgi:hypothetical protein